MLHEQTTAPTLRSFELNRVYTMFVGKHVDEHEHADEHTARACAVNIMFMNDPSRCDLPWCGEPLLPNVLSQRSTNNVLTCSNACRVRLRRHERELERTNTLQ